jgi:hypothetical protein
VVVGLDAHLAAGFLLAAHVDGRGRIVAHEHRREPDWAVETRNLLGHLATNPLGKSFSVHQSSHGATR